MTLQKRFARAREKTESVVKEGSAESGKARLKKERPITERIAAAKKQEKRIENGSASKTPDRPTTADPGAAYTIPKKKKEVAAPVKAAPETAALPIYQRDTYTPAEAYAPGLQEEPEELLWKQGKQLPVEKTPLYTALERVRSGKSLKPTLEEVYAEKVLPIYLRDTYDPVEAYAPGLQSISRVEEPAGYPAPRQKQKKLKSPTDSDIYQRYREYAEIPQAVDFEEKSQYHSTYQPGTEKFNALIGQYVESGYGDLTYDILNKDPKAIARGSVANYKSYNDVDDGTLKVFNYIYSTKGADAAYQYLEDMAVGERFSGIEAMALGAYHGSGLSSVSALLGKGLSAVTGDRDMEKRNKEWYGDFLRDVSQAQEQHPVAYGTGAVGGNLALLYGTGAALGTAEGALAAGIKIGGKTIAVQMAPAVQGVVNSSLSFLTADAVKNAGAAATGYMAPADYLKEIGISGAQGLAGGLAGGLVSSGLADVLRKSGMMTPFMEFVRQSVSGFASAGANIGTGYLLSEEKPSKEQIATDMTAAFLFSVLQSGISTYKTTQSAKAQMNADLDQMAQQYGQMSQNWKTMTPEAREEAASNILWQTRKFQNSLNSQYMAGQQETVDQLNQSLEALAQGMKWYVNGGQSVAIQGNILPFTAGRGSTGLVPTLPTGENGLEEVAENDILNKKDAIALPQDAMVEQLEDLTEEEAAAILAYKSSESYKVNAKLRDGLPLTRIEQGMAEALDRALGKLPRFKGTVYRNLSFGDFGGKEDMDAFLARFTVGERIIFDSYTSTSEIPDGYPLNGKYVVNMQIQSITGRILTGFGNNSEREILFKRGSVFLPIEITIGQDGCPLIILLELEG